MRKDNMLRVWSALLWLSAGLSAAIQEAEPGQFPYTVSLQVRQYERQLELYVNRTECQSRARITIKLQG